MLKKHVSYTFEKDDNCFPVPFEFLSESAILKIEGNKAILGGLAIDDSPSDPLIEFDEGEFYQFGRRYNHYCKRPDIDEFKRIIRANPGRVFFVYCQEHGLVRYYPDTMPLTVKDTKGEQCRANEIESASGYYIVPEDATTPAEYAKGVLQEYTDYCNGSVYGVCVWHYTKENDVWELQERDECWGYYGIEYAEETLKEQMAE